MQISPIDVYVAAFVARCDVMLRPGRAEVDEPGVRRRDSSGNAGRGLVGRSHRVAEGFPPRSPRDGWQGPNTRSPRPSLIKGRWWGSVRLKQSAVPDVLEIGIWLTRQVRGQGLGRLTMIFIL